VLTGGEARSGGSRGVGGRGDGQRRQGHSPVMGQREVYLEAALAGGGGTGRRRQGHEVGRRRPGS
jgi:hypothetical protein